MKTLGILVIRRNLGKPLLSFPVAKKHIIGRNAMKFIKNNCLLLNTTISSGVTTNSSAIYLQDGHGAR